MLDEEGEVVVEEEEEEGAEEEEREEALTESVASVKSLKKTKAIKGGIKDKQELAERVAQMGSYSTAAVMKLKKIRDDLKGKVETTLKLKNAKVPET